MRCFSRKRAPHCAASNSWASPTHTAPAMPNPINTRSGITRRDAGRKIAAFASIIFCFRRRLSIGAARGDRRRNGQPPTGAAGIAFRFATELGVALFVGAGLGWLLDHWLHTAPIFIVVMFLLGAAAGIRNVMRAAAELNAEAAKH